MLCPSFSEVSNSILPLPSNGTDIALEKPQNRKELHMARINNQSNGVNFDTVKSISELSKNQDSKSSVNLETDHEDGPYLAFVALKDLACGRGTQAACEWPDPDVPAYAVPDYAVPDRPNYPAYSIPDEREKD
jgi:hypothetical protein